MNFFNGTRTEFNMRYDEGENPPMTDTVKLESNSTTNRSIRRQTAYPQTPHIVGVSFASLVAGTSILTGATDNYVYASNITYNGIVQAHAGDKWWKVMVNGEVGWVAEIHKGVRYLTVTPVESPPPSPELPEIPYTVILGDDITYQKITLTGTLKPVSQ